MNLASFTKELQQQVFSPEPKELKVGKLEIDSLYVIEKIPRNLELVEGVIL